MTSSSSLRQRLLWILGLGTGLALATAAAGCSGVRCDAVCGPCREPISFTISLTVAGGPIVVEGDVAAAGLECAPLATGEVHCHSATATPGRYRFMLSAAGHETQTLDVMLSPATAGLCCACPSSYGTDIVLTPPGFGDAGPRDGGPRDASLDAPTVDDGGPDADLDADLDAPSTDGGSCDPSAIRFIPPGGAFEEGNLCDDVFVCLSDAAEIAAVEAASASFTCDTIPDGPCSGPTCRYAAPGGPSLLEAAEMDEICAVTIAIPSPDLVCVVYL